MRFKVRNIRKKLTANTLELCDFRANWLAHLGSFGLCGQFECFDAFLACRFGFGQHGLGPLATLLAGCISFGLDDRVHAFYLGL